MMFSELVAADTDEVDMFFKSATLGLGTVRLPSPSNVGVFLTELTNRVSNAAVSGFRYVQAESETFEPAFLAPNIAWLNVPIPEVDFAIYFPNKKVKRSEA